MNEFRRYTFVDSEFFEPISRYAPSSTYADALAELLPGGWETYRSDIWLGAHPVDATYPPQGFKIHVSAIVDTSIETLRRVVPVLVESGVPFKMAGDPTLLRYLNSKRAARGSSGKFMTVYPPSREVFETLVARLHECTRNLEGPYILSDKRFADSKVVFYRYGGFSRMRTLNADGTTQSVIQASDGTVVPDIRTPYFQLPDGIDDPFPTMDETGGPDGPVILGGRFEVEEALAFSNAGGVYRARDLQTGEAAVIKEARPFTNAWSLHGDQLDSVGILQREYDMLQLMMTTGVVVQPLAFFHEWEHAYLAEAFVEGIPLRQFRARDAIVLTSYMDDRDRVHRFSTVFREVARGLVEAVRCIHALDVVLGDLSPNNIMVDPRSLEVTLIDVESAHVRGDVAERIARGWYTPGFRPAAEAGGRTVTFADDLYAAGMSLYSMLHPVQQLFAFHPPAASRFMERFVQAGLPTEIKSVIAALCQGDADTAANHLSTWTSLDGVPLRWDPMIWNPESAAQTSSPT